jgi:hypothetical protein
MDRPGSGATCPPTTLCCHTPKQEPGTASHLAPGAVVMPAVTGAAGQEIPGVVGPGEVARVQPSSPDAWMVQVGVGLEPPRHTSAPLQQLLPTFPSKDSYSCLSTHSACGCPFLPPWEPQEPAALHLQVPVCP